MHAVAPNEATTTAAAAAAARCSGDEVGAASDCAGEVEMTAWHQLLILATDGRVTDPGSLRSGCRPPSRRTSDSIPHAGEKRA